MAGSIAMDVGYVCVCCVRVRVRVRVFLSVFGCACVWVCNCGAIHRVSDNVSGIALGRVYVFFFFCLFRQCKLKVDTL
jgi:hypothetical protein